MIPITLEYGSLILPGMAGWKGAYGVVEEDLPFPHGPVAGDGETAQPTAIEEELAHGRLEAHIDQLNGLGGDVVHDTGGRCRGCRPPRWFCRRSWAGHRLDFSVVRPAHHLPGFCIVDRAVGIYWLGHTAVGAGGVPNATEVEFGVKITVIGLGYVGTVAAACLSDAGHDVTGVDIDSDRIGTLQAGRAPFFEPGLEELLQAVEYREVV